MVNSDFYLENMPIAFCVLEVLTDDEGKPVDFVFVYSNKAYARMEGYDHEEIAGKRYRELCGEPKEKRLSCYYDTIVYRKEHVLNEYDPKRDKHFMIHTYPLEEGYCGCILQDVTESRKMEMRLLYEQEKGKFLLESTTEIVFEYDQNTHILTFGDGGNIREENRVLPDCPESLVTKKLISREYLDKIEKAVQTLKSGERAVEFNIQASLDEDGAYRWYTVSCSRYTEQYTGHMRIVGYLRNAEQMVRSQNALKKEAMYDPLVDLFNVKTGRGLVSEILERAGENEVNIMFLLDLDNFKRVNDTYGHQKGDEFLKKFAVILRNTFRKSDIVYRMGGDEFIGFTANVAKPDQAVEKIMERLYGQLEKAEREGFQMKCSVGIFMSSQKCTYSHFYRMADQALYAAKRSGKNKYWVIREL